MTSIFSVATKQPQKHSSISKGILRKVRKTVDLKAPSQTETPLNFKGNGILPLNQTCSYWRKVTADRLLIQFKKEIAQIWIYFRRFHLQLSWRFVIQNAPYKMPLDPC